MTIKGLDRVSAKLTSLAKFTAWATPPMQQTVALIHDDIAKYPTKAAGAFSRMASPRQKRAYWARVRKGEIRHGPGGYVRSGTLGRKWTTKVSGMGNGVRGEVGNNANYAGWVQQASAQQNFHKASGWPTDRSVIRATEQNRRRIWEAAIRRELSR